MVIQPGSVWSFEEDTQQHSNPTLFLQGIHSKLQNFLPTILLKQFKCCQDALAVKTSPEETTILRFPQKPPSVWTCCVDKYMCTYACTSFLALLIRLNRYEALSEQVFQGRSIFPLYEMNERDMKTKWHWTTWVSNKFCQISLLHSNDIAIFQSTKKQFSITSEIQPNRHSERECYVFKDLW